MLRIVLYAEGASDLAGPTTLPPAPSAPLADEHLGPAHIMVRRILAEHGHAAIRFESPLRTRRGRAARGSDLHHEPTLRQLLRWGRTDLQPDLAIVLVDADDERRRAERLEAATENVGVKRIVAAAFREFEAWLVADTRALRETLGLDISTTKDPESMARREAKELLASWASEAARTQAGVEPPELRRQLAGRCDLDELGRRCPSFTELRLKLKAF